MPTLEFPSRSQCREHLRAVLSLDAYGHEKDAALEGLLKGLTDACEDPATDPQGELRWQFGRWVIRDEDLNLFATVKDVITPVAAVGGLLSSLEVAGVTAIVFGLTDLLRKVYRKGGVLTRQQAEIVTVLRAHSEPLSRADILRELPPESPPWTEETVEAELWKLCAVPTNGGPMAIVQHLHDGKWCALGV